ARLAAEALRLGPRAVVLLGDSFHDGAGEERLAPDDRQALRALAAGAELVWIVGNHDAQGPSRLPGSTVDQLSIAGLSLVHEPAAAPRPGEVAGHLHPCAKVKGRAASVRRRCFVTDGERLVMPAFGAFAGGLNVRDRAFRGLFERLPLAVALGERRAHPIAWAQLGGD
ncbi:MAG TPA: ligase-associated DNA damage response endonuclease PdeM, partial [Caulobacteraceae bacterium]|nr:ligase-associated DNA damage response endonuclease PdeM [Caulobacteraceae bacterium]